jgi:hypothetical protein
MYLSILTNPGNIIIVKYDRSPSVCHLITFNLLLLVQTRKNQPYSKLMFPVFYSYTQQIPPKASSIEEQIFKSNLIATETVKCAKV